MATTLAQGRRQIDLEDLCRLPTIWFPSVSTAGGQVAFYWDVSGRLELHVLDLESRNVRQLSHGEMPAAVKFPNLVWDRDDRFILFHRDRQGDEQHEIFRIDVETGEVRQLTHDSAGWQIPIASSPQNDWVSVLSGRPRPGSGQRSGQLNLWKLRPDGSEYIPITDFPAPVFVGGRWSPDGRWLTAASNDDLTDLKNEDGYLASADGAEVRKVFRVRPGSQEAVVAWHPDGQRVAVTSDASGATRVGILDLPTSSVDWLTPEGVDEGILDLESVARFSPDGRLLLTVRGHESQARPVVYDLSTGAARLLELPDGVVSFCAFVNGGGQVMLRYSTDTCRPGLILYDLVTDTWQWALAADSGGIDAQAFVGSQHVYYPSSDGTSIPALLYVPKRIQSGERIPALVFVHGGPTGQWMRAFDPYVQFLVDRGLVVLAPNVRGSTGYGASFRDAVIHDWGGRDLDDLAAGVEYLRTLPFVDVDRLVVFGGSYGGFMSFMALTKRPELWKAGIAWVGISDLKTLYQESNDLFRYFLRRQMGSPEENAALWADRSAINFAHNLKAKLLMVHGVNDSRCPVSQSRAFCDRLLELGRKEGEDFEYVEFADEGHGSNDIQQKIRTFQILGDYLDRVL